MKRVVHSHLPLWSEGLHCVGPLDAHPNHRKSTTFYVCLFYITEILFVFSTLSLRGFYYWFYRINCLRGFAFASSRVRARHDSPNLPGAVDTKNVWT